jgi:two-component system KDP operon response regulator KdpE
MPANTSIVDLILSASLVVQLVMLLLLAASVTSWAIIVRKRRVLRQETEIRLTPKEFELLSLLARNHDRVLTHRSILKAIWGPNAVEQPEHLWTLVAQLRKRSNRTC